jgi:TfoX/Sxy family transcriptional regulator of competence genes
VADVAIDQKLAERLRAALAGGSVREVKMFGGLGFMLNGNLVACIGARGLLVRVGEAAHAEALARGAAPMVMNGRQMKGYVRVESELDARTVGAWMRRARAFVETLPTKEPKARPARKKRSKS